MSPSAPHPDAISALPLPAKFRTRLSEMTVALGDSLGDELVSVVVYGSVVRGEWDEQTSDVNVLVVVDSIAFDRLADVAPAMERARKKARVSPMIMTAEELRQASDVFCIKFDDIRRHHVCIAGRDVLDGLLIEDAHLRFVCEFRLRNVGMRTRRIFLSTHGDKRAEQDILLQLFTGSLFSLRALARLQGHTPGPKVRGDFSAIGHALDADISVLNRLADVHRSGEKLRQPDLTRLYGEFNALVHRAVEVVDGMDAQ